MKLFNREKRERVIIVGCGSLGSKLATILANQNDAVSIIDIDENSFVKLPATYHEFCIDGDATDTDILELAGIKTADRLLALTNDDNTNIMIAQIAKEYYKVKQVIAKIDDATKEASYAQTGITAICPLLLSLNEFERIFKTEKEGCSA